MPDAGCLSGHLSAVLRAKGAVVTGFESSPAMLDLARQAPLAELHRILRPGGRLLLSVNHPCILESSDPHADYFSVTQYSEEYTFGVRSAVLTYRHRPLHAMSDAFTQAGFRISVISEPPFSRDTPRELLPPGIGDHTAFICFIFVVLEGL